MPQQSPEKKRSERLGFIRTFVAILRWNRKVVLFHSTSFPYTLWPVLFSYTSRQKVRGETRESTLVFYRGTKETRIGDSWRRKMELIRTRRSPIVQSFTCKVLGWKQRVKWGEFNTLDLVQTMEQCFLFCFACFYFTGQKWSHIETATTKRTARERETLPDKKE